MTNEEANFCGSVPRGVSTWLDWAPSWEKSSDWSNASPHNPKGFFCWQELPDTIINTQIIIASINQKMELESEVMRTAVPNSVFSSGSRRAYLSGDLPIKPL